MKIKGENLLFEIVKKMYCCLGERKFTRQVLANRNNELNYGQVKELWEDESRLVHGDFGKGEDWEASENHYSRINTVMRFKETDKVIDIGCGDGAIDNHIHVEELYGIDISESKLKEAKKKNPNYRYHNQSFLDELDFAGMELYNKYFSYGVFQYCKPEDADRLIRNSIEFILEKGNSELGGVYHRK